MSNENEIFSRRLKQLAANRQLTQTALGRACNVTPQSAQRWFSGAALPRPTYIPTLAKLLGVTTDELVLGVPSLEHSLGNELPDDSPVLATAKQNEVTTPGDVLAQTRASRVPNAGRSKEVTLMAQFYEALELEREAQHRRHRREADAYDLARALLLTQLQWHGYDLDHGNVSAIAKLWNVRAVGSSRLCVIPQFRNSELDAMDMPVYGLTLYMSGPTAGHVANARRQFAESTESSGLPETRVLGEPMTLFHVYPFLRTQGEDADEHLHFAVIPLHLLKDTSTARSLLGSLATYMAECAGIPDYWGPPLMRRLHGADDLETEGAEDLLRQCVDCFDLELLAALRS